MVMHRCYFVRSSKLQPPEKIFTFFQTTTRNLSESAAEKLADLLAVSSVARALSQPHRGDLLDVQLSEGLVLQVLRRPLLDTSKKLEFFRWCSNVPDYKHSARTYSHIFHAICNSPRRRLHEDDIFALLSSMENNGLTVDSPTFKLLLDSFIKDGKFDAAIRVLDHVEKRSSNDPLISCLSPDVYTSVLVALIRQNQLAMALTIFYNLLDGDPASTPSAVACNELLLGLRKGGLKTHFEQIFSRLRGRILFPFDRYGYNICIHAFGIWGDLSTSLSLFKEMKERGDSFSPDICTHNSIIQGLCMQGKVKDALVVWEELKASSSGHEPDAFSYGIIIRGCSKSYRINDAIRIFNEMQYSRLRADTTIYNSLLDGLFKARRLTEACYLFEQMVEDDNVRASCWTYNIIIDGLIKNGREEAAYSLFWDLKKKSNNFVDAVTFSIIILHLSKEDRLEESLNLVAEMQARGFVVDLVTITSLLIAFYRNGRWDWMERLMKHIREGNLVPSVLKWKSSMEDSLSSPQRKAKDFTPMFPATRDISETLGISGSVVSETETKLDLQDSGLLSDGVDTWSSSQHMDMLANEASSSTGTSKRLLSLNRGKRVEAEVHSFDIDMVNTYLSIFLSKGKLSLACKLFEIFTDMGVEPKIYTFNSLMTSFVKKGYIDEAWGVFQVMDEKFVRGDIATFNIIIHGLGKKGRADLANAVLNKLTSDGGYLDIVMYNTLINALGKAGQIEDATELFQQMKGQGTNPDVVTYNTLIDVHSKAGIVKDAHKFLKMMLDDGCTPNHVTDTTLDFLEKEIERQEYKKASIHRSFTEDIV